MFSIEGKGYLAVLTRVKSLPNWPITATKTVFKHTNIGIGLSQQLRLNSDISDSYSGSEIRGPFRLLTSLNVLK
jgi:hypothetical protein